MLPASSLPKPCLTLPAFFIWHQSLFETISGSSVGHILACFAQLSPTPVSYISQNLIESHTQLRDTAQVVGTQIFWGI
jgi:hypothetical protein